jgi:DtxR family Mn-dependent transcriptional regulator
MAAQKADLSTSVQDYLKAIYRLTAGGEAATTNLIAEEIGISPASVTVMVQRMAKLEPPLVEYKKYQGVFLTEQGRLEGLHVIRRHRLIELFLVEQLGYSWEEVHAEAEKLEHSASEKFVDRLAELLGNPAFDPHGDPIPDKNLQIPVSHTVELASIQSGERVIVRQIESSDASLLTYLKGVGVYPGVRLEVTRLEPFDHTMQLKLLETGREAVFGPEVAGRIHVERLKPES